MKKDDKKKPSSRKANLTQEDKALWAYVTQDVTPIKHENAVAENSENEAAEDAPVPQAPNVTVQPQFLPDAGKPAAAPSRTAHDLHSHADIDARSFDRFRKGEMPIEATLDLHGLTQQNAYDRVVSFITSQVAQGKRCVMIITGKGRNAADGEIGVLKQMLPIWLEQPTLKTHILKMRTARHFHGGSGAYYLLLKRRK